MAKILEQQQKRLVKLGPVQRLAPIEAALEEMLDDEERRDALIYFSRKAGLLCERVDKRVPGTDLRPGEIP